MNLSILVPVYNEGKNIERVISAIGEKVKTPHRIFLIYDFEEDDTLPAAEKLMLKQQNITLLRNKYGRGVLKAIKTGFEEARNDAVVVMMADLADDPLTVDEMCRKIKQGYDVVCGTRYSKGGKHFGGSPVKSFLSRLAGLSLHFLIGIPTFDVTNAFKMYRMDVLKTIQIESRGGFELSMEITLKAYFAGFKITEVPTVWRDRTRGTSKFKFWAWLPSYLHWYFWALKQRLSFLNL